MVQNYAISQIFPALKGKKYKQKKVFLNGSALPRYLSKNFKNSVRIILIPTCRNVKRILTFIDTVNTHTHT